MTSTHSRSQYVAQSDRPHPTERRIRAFCRLEPGWNYGEGVGFREEVLALAVELHRRAVSQGFYVTDAFPGPSGEVAVSLYEGPITIEFVVLPSLEIEYVLERDDEELDRAQGLTLEQAVQRIMDVRKGLCRLSASSSRSGMSCTRNASAAWPFVIPARVAEEASPSSTWIAYAIPADPSAYTSASITRRSPQNPRYTGDSQQMRFLLASA